MAMPDSGESNEVCDIVNCVAIYYKKGANSGYKNGLLFPDPQSHRILRWIKNEGRVEVFAGVEVFS